LFKHLWLWARFCPASRTEPTRQTNFAPFGETSSTAQA
jgi:hypothetical protein